MKNMVAIHFDRLHNEEHFEFLRQVIALVHASSDAVKAAVGDVLPQLEALEVREDAALEFFRSKVYTREQQELDRVREQLHTALRMLVGAYGRCLDPAATAAAARMQFVLDHYGSVRQLGNAEKTGVLHNLTADLREKCADVLPLFGADVFVAALEQANIDFEAAMARRLDYNAVLNEDREPVPPLRRAVAAAYRQLTARIEGAIALSPAAAADCRDFVYKLNGRIRYFNDTARGRSGNGELRITN